MGELSSEVKVTKLPAVGPPPGRSVSSWVAQRDRESRKEVERGRWLRKPQASGEGRRPEPGGRGGSRT